MSRRTAAKREAWLSLLSSDPRPALLASDEPFARFVTMTDVLGKSEDDAEVRATRQAVVADRRVRALVGRLPGWESGFTFSGHNSPGFPPNILRLLYGMGVRRGDFAPIERLLDRMLKHQADDGRFLTPGGTTGRQKEGASWASLPCDHFAILEVLLLFGRRDAPGIRSALARVRDTFAETTQGPGWHCIPDPVARWRGPGRKNDACLQVTVEALRLFGLVAARDRPQAVSSAARTLLGAWRGRREKPYMFGHGPRFAAGKWPPTWYDASAVLEALAPYAVWRGGASSTEDRKSAQEIVGALASTIGPDGLVTPRSCYQGFESYSFGQKQRPSPWATARVCGLLRAFSSLKGAGTVTP